MPLLGKNLHQAACLSPSKDYEKHKRQQDADKHPYAEIEQVLIHQFSNAQLTMVTVATAAPMPRAIDIASACRTALIVIPDPP